MDHMESLDYDLSNQKIIKLNFTIIHGPFRKVVAFQFQPTQGIDTNSRIWITTHVLRILLSKVVGLSNSIDLTALIF